MLGYQLLKLIGLDAMRIDGRRNHLSAIQTKALDGGQKSRPFHDDLVTLLQHGFTQQIQCLLAAGGNDQLIGSHIRHALACHEGRQLLAQRLVALGRTILQGRACLFLQRLGRRRANARHVKHGAIGKSTRKTDDAGLAQQLEQFTDRRGFNVVESIGKLHTF